MIHTTRRKYGGVKSVKTTLKRLSTRKNPKVEQYNFKKELKRSTSRKLNTIKENKTNITTNINKYISEHEYKKVETILQNKLSPNDIKLLMYADTYHDFNAIKEEINKISIKNNRKDIDTYFNDNNITPYLVEDSTTNYFEKKYSLNSNKYIPGITTEYNNNNIHSFTPSNIESYKLVINENDNIIDNNTKTKILQFFFNDYNVVDKYIIGFSFDAASHQIITYLYNNFNKIVNYRTPQNILDSARTSDNIFPLATRNIIPDIKCIASSNFFTKDKYNFYIESNNNKQYYQVNDIKNNIKHNINIKSSGPSIDKLKLIIQSCGKIVDKSKCVDNILESFNMTNYAVLFDKLSEHETIELAFDIKRMGDHEQANAVFHLNNNYNKPTVFVTIDKLAALYSRCLGNPTILYSTHYNSITCYKGNIQQDPIDAIKADINYRLETINYIYNTYTHLINIYPSFTNLYNNIKYALDNILNVDTLELNNILLKAKVLDIYKFVDNINNIITNINNSYLSQYNDILQMVNNIELNEYIQIAINTSDITKLTEIQKILENVFTNEFNTELRILNENINKIALIIDPITHANILYDTIYNIDSGSFVNNTSIKFDVNILKKLKDSITKLFDVKLVDTKSRAAKRQHLMATTNILRNEDALDKIKTDISTIENKIKELEIYIYEKQYIKNVTKKRTKKVNRGSNKAQRNIVDLTNNKQKLYYRLNALLDGVKLTYLHINDKIQYNKNDVNRYKKEIDNILIDFFATFFYPYEIDFMKEMRTHIEIGKYIADYIDSELNKKASTSGGGVKAASHMYLTPVSSQNINSYISHNKNTSIDTYKNVSKYELNSSHSKKIKLHKNDIDVISEAFINVFEKTLTFINQIKDNKLFTIRNI